MIMKQCGKFYYPQAPSPRTEARTAMLVKCRSYNLTPLIWRIHRDIPWFSFYCAVHAVILVLIIIIMMGSYNARLIYPIGYSRRRCGATAALIRQPQNHPHNEEPEIRNRILWEGVRVFECVPLQDNSGSPPLMLGIDWAHGCTSG